MADIELPARRSSALLLGAALLALLIFNGWAVHVGWESGLLQGNEFRQTQTALTTLFVQREHNFALAYPTPVLGKPWSIPMEFPLYQWTVALYSSATHTPLIQSGRAISYLCFLLALPPLWLLLRRLGLSLGQTVVVLGLVLTCPLYIFYARAFLIETMALMFGLWFLQGFVAAIADRRLSWLIVANLAGTAAGLVKVTTFMLYVAPAAVCAAVWLFRARAESGKVRRLFGWMTAAVALPFAATLWWIHFSDAVKSLNAAGAQLASSSMSAYHFGTWAVRRSSAPWLSHWNVTTTNIVSVGLLVGFALVAAVFGGRWRKWIVAALLLFAAGPLTFPVLYSWHEYYFVANAVLLMIAMGLALGGWLEFFRFRWFAWLGVAAFLAAQISTYFHFFYTPQAIVHDGGSGLTLMVRDMTEPDDVIIVAGNDWNSSIPFYSERRALMIRRDFEHNWTYVEQAFADLKGESVTALVLVAGQRDNRELLERAARTFGIDPAPFAVWHDQTLYVNRPHRAEFARQLANISYDEVQWANPTERVTNGEPQSVAKNTQRFFAGLEPTPRRYQVPFGLNLRSLPDDRRCFDAHASTRLWFAAPPHARRIVLSFGIIDEAWTREAGRSDGVDFSVTVVLADGSQQKIFNRFLNPAATPADRGRQQAVVTLPDSTITEILFETGPGPYGSNAFDWAYLDQLQVY